MRTRKIKANPREIAVILYGINRQGSVVRISAYDQGDNVRLSGANGTHNVHLSNSKDIDGWKREAALVWKLTDLIDIDPRHATEAFSKDKIDELTRKAEDRKRQLAGSLK